MDTMLRHNEDVDDRTQGQLLNDLFALEHRFKTVLLSSPSGAVVYQKFMDFILNEKGNILTTRVYFRERQKTFSKKISVAFHKKNPSSLHKFKINYLFAKWACQHYKGPNKRTLNNLLKKIGELRKIICENNLPLAINRSKIFWSKVPESHLDYMDLIQTASEGLMNAIDKFVPPYRTVFRAVAIGRMTLNMITDNNSTLLKFSPKERRILYRANNAKNKRKLFKDEEIVNYVSESFDGVTNQSLHKLIAAASRSTASIDEKRGDALPLIDKISGDVSLEDTIVLNDFTTKFRYAITKLPLMMHKVIRLKFGV